MEVADTAAEVDTAAVVEVATADTVEDGGTVAGTAGIVAQAHIITPTVADHTADGPLDGGMTMHPISQVVL